MRRPRPFRTPARHPWSSPRADAFADAGTAELRIIRDRRLSEVTDRSEAPRPTCP
jgi:hypothetical protein